MNLRSLHPLAVLLIGALLCTYAGCGFTAEPIDDASARFHSTQDLRESGEFDAALAEISTLRSEFPRNVDYALARAQILVALQRDQEALAELAAATKLAPDYEAVWRLRFAVLTRSAHTLSASERESLQRLAAARYPHADWWQALNEVDRTRWTVLVGGGYDDLSNNLPSWNNQFAALQMRPNQQSFHELQVTRNQRFSDGDLGVRIGTDHTLKETWYVGADIATVSNPVFSPELAFSTHVGRALPAGWTADIRYRQRNYASDDVATFTATAEKYFGDFRTAYGLSASRLNSTSTTIGHSISGNWYYSDNTSFGLTLSFGEEAEAVGANQVLETDVSGLAISGRHQLTQRLQLQWWAGMHEQGDIYRRRYLGVAFSIRI